MLVPTSAKAKKNLLTVIEGAKLSHVPPKTASFTTLVKIEDIGKIIRTSKSFWRIYGIPHIMKDSANLQEDKVSETYIITCPPVRDHVEGVTWLVHTGKELPEVTLRVIATASNNRNHYHTPTMETEPNPDPPILTDEQISSAPKFYAIGCSYVQLLWLAAQTEVSNDVLTASVLVTLFPWVKRLAVQKGDFIAFSSAVDESFVEDVDSTKIVHTHQNAYCKMAIALGLFIGCYSREDKVADQIKGRLKAALEAANESPLPQGENFAWFAQRMQRPGGYQNRILDYMGCAVAQRWRKLDDGTVEPTYDPKTPRSKLLSAGELERVYGGSSFAFHLLKQIRMVYEDLQLTTVKWAYNVADLIREMVPMDDPDWISEMEMADRNRDVANNCPYTKLSATPDETFQASHVRKLCVIAVQVRLLGCETDDQKKNMEKYALPEIANHVSDGSARTLCFAIADCVPSSRILAYALILSINGPEAAQNTLAKLAEKERRHVELTCVKLYPHSEYSLRFARARELEDLTRFRNHIQRNYIERCERMLRDARRSIEDLPKEQRPAAEEQLKAANKAMIAWEEADSGDLKSMAEKLGMSKVDHLSGLYKLFKSLSEACRKL